MEENKLSIQNELAIEDIKNLIYTIRGKQVMMDSDVANIYHCETKYVNRVVKRNIERFPEEFCFQLNENEFEVLRCQFVTLNENGRGQHRKYLPYVFTEQGVAMLSSVLHSETAVTTSIKIINAFIAMRKYISTNLIEQKYINILVLEDHEKIKALESSFAKFEEKRKVNEIYFNGQIYDAYSKIQEIFNEAKQGLIIIDSYADYTLLDIIKRLNVKTTIITKPNNLLTKQDIIRYSKQYNNLKVIYDNTFHDRYFILDSNIVYHCGASVNRIGYKTFSITLINDEEICQALINKVYKIIKENGSKYE